MLSKPDELLWPCFRQRWVTGYLKAVWLETFGPVFTWFLVETDPRDPPRSPGPVPHISVHEKSAPQTNSTAKWRRTTKSCQTAFRYPDVAICTWVFSIRFFDRPEIVDFGSLSGRGRCGNPSGRWCLKEVWASLGSVVPEGSLAGDFRPSCPGTFGRNRPPGPP